MKHCKAILIASSSLGQKKRCILVDSLGCKKECFPDKVHAVGSLVSCFLTHGFYGRQSSGSLCMYASELLAVPTALAQQDILFLHHLFEVSRFFLSYECPNPQVFALLCLVYDIPALIRNSVNQKLLLYKLFVLLGLYPEHDDALYLAERLAQIPLSHLFALDIGISERRLTDLLHACLAVHPCVQKFKTMHFLDA